MKTPEMILFDYGHTLLYEPDFDFLRGEHALFPYITKNRDQLTPAQVHAFADTLFTEFSAFRKSGRELHERQFQRMVYEYLGIEFSIGYEEAELILWNAASPGALMPQADTMIDDLNQREIRTGVISNIGWSENALRNRIDRLLPRHRFEFIIASSEYGYRKPSPRIFELALKKAGVSPENVWFCGDNPQADIEGAANAAIFPIWYDNGTESDYRDRSCESPPTCGHLHIREWDELLALLDQCADTPARR